MTFGFKRHELRDRYNVISIVEDRWHAYTGEKTAEIISRHIRQVHPSVPWLLNAGAGIYRIGAAGWREIPVDLFLSPLRHRNGAICASVERLPLKPQIIGAIVCVGEVLAYCDPAAAIREFANVLAPGGTLICDFASSRSPRYWFKQTYGRAADLITDVYNGEPERTWIYDPRYIESLLQSAGFSIERTLGIHQWSALARRAGVSADFAVTVQRLLGKVRVPPRFSDLTTIVASRSASGR